MVYKEPALPNFRHLMKVHLLVRKGTEVQLLQALSVPSGPLQSSAPNNLSKCCWKPQDRDSELPSEQAAEYLHQEQQELYDCYTLKIQARICSAGDAW